MKIIYIILIILIIWSIYGYFSSKAEKAKYTVLEVKNDYEIRKYAEHIVAETVVNGSYDNALNEGFRLIANFIFGNNTKKESIAMTTPVLESKQQSEKIAMTTPVLATIDGESHTVVFVMPSSYTLETLPKPNDSRIKIVKVNEMKMAVLRFGWYRSDSSVMKNKEKLLNILKNDNVKIKGEPKYAGYNAPWTPPWMTRNEVMVEIE